MGQRHVVMRQVVELELPTAQEAQKIYGEVGRICRQRLQGLLEKCCDELSQPDRLHRIDRIELDLGCLDSSQMETELSQRFAAALKQQLAQHIDALESGVASHRLAPKTQSQLELLTLFARHGTLPWWADSSRPGLLAESLRYLLRESPADLRSQLRALIREPTALSRIARTFDADQLAGIHRMFLVHSTEFLSNLLIQLPRLLPRLGSLTTIPATRLRHSLHAATLQVVTARECSQAEPLTLYREILIRLSLHLGLTYAQMVKGLIAQIALEPALFDQSTTELTQRLHIDLPGIGGTNAEITGASRPLPLGKSNATGERFGLPGSQPETLAAIPSSGEMTTDLRDEMSGSVTTATPRSAAQDNSNPADEHDLDPDKLQETKIAAAISNEYTIQKRDDSGGAATVTAPQSAQSGKSKATGEGYLDSDEHPKATAATASSSEEALAEADEFTTAIRIDFSDTDEVYVANAGLVLLWPFLGHFFTRLDVLANDQFVEEACRHRAVGVLQYLVDQETQPAEYLLTLNKVLCGMDPDAVLEFDEPVNAREAEECGDLLQAAIAHAAILNDMSAEGFRGAFLHRAGQLSSRDGVWLLRIEGETHDVVLAQFPWRVDWIKLPWMTAPMQVEW